ncbi:MAG: sigma-70 family RNA polymerase sigma factor [Flammeovirgaceae bacterium]|jgi:RNA polymerase sigma factor (sigma-70 family)|nr:sigma-70 family RNA polymerase sigma factor [Flammeovirgaceae bacterium]
MNVITSGYNVDEELLFLACQHKNEVALETLYHRFGNRIFKVAMSAVRNKQEAEEVVQDVFLSIWNGSARFDGKSKAYTWLYRVCLNKAIERVRKRESKSRWLFWAKDAAEQKADPIDFNTPLVELEEQEKRELAEALINQLPQKQKLAFSLFYLSELSYQEVAQTMDTTISAVESLLFRARKNLEQLLNS